MVNIVEVLSKKDENIFISLPKKIYKDNKYYVFPLISEMKKSIQGKNNTLRECGPYKMAIAYIGDVPVGRILCGINNILNEAKGYREGYISLFESIDDYSVAKSLFDFSTNFFKEYNMEKIIGPLSLPDGDDCRGLLIDCFDDSPYIMNLYNPPYYQKFFEEYGFYKYFDCYAYEVNVKGRDDKRYEELVPKAMSKYGFKIDKLNKKDFKKDMEDIKKILELAMPKEWDDFIPPSDEEMELIAKNLLPVADEDLILIARDNEGNPIGFDIALPDYNQVIKRLDGKLFPFGIFKFLYYKKKINRARLFVLFVVPKWRRKGVTSAIYLQLSKVMERKGYETVEGSTIWEYNTPMRNDIEKTGAKIKKTFRIYKKDI